jgi:PhoH-like ATPase
MPKEVTLGHLKLRGGLMGARYTPDTNLLINQPFYLQNVSGEIFIPFVVLQELDKLKFDSGVRGFQARQAVRILKQMKDKITYVPDEERVGDNLWIEKNDDKIIASALKNNATLITGDYLVELKAKSFGLEVIAVDEMIHVDSSVDYTGIKEIYFDLSNNEDNIKLADFYENKHSYGNENMVKNQYLSFWDLSKPTFNEDGIVNGYENLDLFKFDGNSLTDVKFKNLKNPFTGTVKPLNIKQKMLFDLLQSKETTVKATFGGFGVGKDFVMISHAIQLLQEQKIKSLVWVRNNVEVKDSNPIGFLPDSMESKLLPFAMPLADHLGGVDGLKQFMLSGKVEIQHMGFLRGRDIKDSIIYVTECENNTKEHIQLLIGRVSKGSQLWVNGDTKQIDDYKFTFNNGVNSIKKLKGQPLYGQVTLDKVERSETAKLSSLLD